MTAKRLITAAEAARRVGVHYSLVMETTTHTNPEAKEATMKRTADPLANYVAPEECYVNPVESTIDHETLTCAGCGYEFPAGLGKYGCPNCNADDLPAERPSDLIDDGIGLRARGGLVYFA
ncbi:MAG TPA: hypothetical protein VFH61_11165 [Thermoleophilia bacterium]|nr:hypothetical protein [Thermoleophilia bacterium]